MSCDLSKCSGKFPKTHEIHKVSIREGSKEKLRKMRLHGYNRLQIVYPRLPDGRRNIRARMNNDKAMNEISPTFYVLPSSNGQIGACPELLTPDEVVRFLRLDVDGPADPLQTLRYYRERGLLHGVKVGKRLRYTRKELLRFLDRLSEKVD